MLILPLPESCDNHSHAIRVLKKFNKGIVCGCISLYDYDARNRKLPLNYKSIKKTKLLELYYNRSTNKYVLVSLQYDNHCKIQYTKKKKRAYIIYASDRYNKIKYWLDSFTPTEGKFDGLCVVSDTIALGIVLCEDGKSVYTRSVYAKSQTTTSVYIKGVYPVLTGVLPVTKYPKKLCIKGVYPVLVG